MCAQEKPPETVDLFSRFEERMEEAAGRFHLPHTALLGWFNFRQLVMQRKYLTETGTHHAVLLRPVFSAEDEFVNFASTLFFQG